MYSKLIEIARTMALNHRDYRRFHMTFIMYRNRVISVGTCNPNKTHPRNLNYPYENPGFKGIHSELDAIIKLGEEDCRDYTFINIKIDKNNNTAVSRPCVGCAALLHQVGYKKLLYSVEEDKFEEWKN